MLKITQLNNGDISDHGHDCQDILWQGGLIDPKKITLENIDKFEDIVDEMSLRFEKTFS